MRVVVALAVIAAASGAAAEPPAAGPPLSLESIGIKATPTYKLSVYSDTTPNDDRLVHNEGILQVEWARRLAPWLDVKLVVLRVPPT